MQHPPPWLSWARAVAVLLSLLPGLAAAQPAAPKPGTLPPAASASAPKPCPDTMQTYDGGAELVECSCTAAAMQQGSVWGSGPYTSDSRVCRAARHAGVIGAAGGALRVQMGPGAPRYPGSTRNGVQSSDYAAWPASFSFAMAPLAAAPQAQSAAVAPTQCPDTLSSYAGSDEVVECVCPVGTPNATIWGSDTYTADSHLCRAAQHAGYLGRAGGTAIRARMLPGAPRYPGSTRNGITSQDFGAYRASFRFEGERVAATAPAAPAGSVDACPATMNSYAGSEEVLRCACPATAAAGSVWGSDAYTADSALCAAAQHAGAVGRRGGEVTVRMLPGLPRYPGTSRNGVQSRDFGAYGASFRFDGLAAAGPQICPDSMTAYAGSDEQLTCVCTGEAVMRSVTIWGSTTYTADSATCRAARHAGVTPLTGGTVALRMLPGEPRYPGSTRNGVQSQDYGTYAASFRFEGAQNLAAGSPVQAPVADSLRRTGRVSLYVTFRTGSADLDIAAAPVLMQVRDALAADPALRLNLVGHTDNQGGPGINVPLSQRRADSVRTWLVQNGVEAGRLATQGRGQSQPIADNGSEAGRSVNRRVEAIRLDQSGSG